MMLLVEEINEPSKCEEMNVSDMRSPVWELFQSNTTDYQMLREIAFQLSSSLKSDVCASTVLGESLNLPYTICSYSDLGTRGVTN